VGDVLDRCPDHTQHEHECEACCWHKTKAEEVIAALAARSGVSHDAITNIAIDLDIQLHDDLGDNVPYIVDALRLALATAEARHAEREREWRELDALYRSTAKNGPSADESIRRAELRRALGLEG
jgi:hypothetical protein